MINHTTLILNNFHTSIFCFLSGRIIYNTFLSPKYLYITTSNTSICKGFTVCNHLDNLFLFTVKERNFNIITNLDLPKPAVSEYGKVSGSLRTSSDAFEIVAEDVGDVNDVIELTRLHSSVRISSIMIFSDELDTNGSPTLATDCGIYLTDGTVKDADAFGTAVTTGWGDAAGAGVEFITEAGAVPIANVGKRLWEILGESSDPNVDYDICLRLTAVAATGAAGTISFVIQYSVS
jgi:hypothetical protein